MRVRMFVLIAVGMLCAGALAREGQRRGHHWTQLSLSTCRVDEFLAEHPHSDGRGVVIAVLDTGVEPSIPGLTNTPDGKPKVIDLQDFTGEGDIDLHRVRLDEKTGKLVDYDDDGNPIEYTLPKLPAPPTGEERLFWLGTFPEHRFVNSDVPDLNDNGKTDDEWTVVVTACSGDGDDQAICLVDTNMDRSLADEKPLRNYKLRQDTFTMRRDKPEKEIEPVTFAVNIFLRRHKAVFFWDDGAHGTHVAGIAAGYRINNQDGFNGVAPGAKVIGLKIGKNSIGGVSVTDSIKSALEYAGRYAREHDVPVVCNLSYGVESEIEGHSDIDEWVDDFLQANPYVVFCAAAGNEGPGLSSVGTPAASRLVMSIGAMMAADTARDVAGWKLDDAVITTFSSRGGELDKPDIVVPGWSTSTVPRYIQRGDFWAGTSMATPYATGLCAVLISDAMARHPGVKVRAWDVRRALRESARPVRGATVLDQGWGVPVLPKAAEILDELLKTADENPIIGYHVSTTCPGGYRGKARVAFWRSTWFPSEDRQTFTITPIFAPSSDRSSHTSFTRKFTLRSNADWIKLTQKSVYLRSEQSARVFVNYDADKLREPGLHVGTVDAICDGRVAFRLVSAIIVPYRFTAANGYAWKFEDKTADGWTPTRYFFAVPPGAGSMKLTLTAPDDEQSRTRFEYVFDPTGHGYRLYGAQLDTEGGRRRIVRTFTEQLMPGVWEVPIVANRPDKQWPYELTARFYGLCAEPPVLDGTSGDLVVTNRFDRRIVVKADGRIEGFRKHKEDKFKGLKDTLTYPIKLGEGFNRVRLHLEMDPEDFAQTTDVGVMVTDSSGESVYTSAFEYHRHDATFSASGNLKLVITGGFAVSDDQRKTPITVDIDYLLASPVGVKVTQDGASTISFVPDFPVSLTYKATRALKNKPKGTHPVGYLRLRERYSDDEVLRVPIGTDE